MNKVKSEQLSVVIMMILICGYYIYSHFQDNVVDKMFLDLSCEEFVKIGVTDYSKLTDLQIESDFENKYKGKYLQIIGKIVDINSSGDFRLKCLKSTSLFSDFKINIKGENEKNFLLGKNIGDYVEVKGRILDYPTIFSDGILNNAEISNYTVIDENKKQNLENLSKEKDISKELESSEISDNNKILKLKLLKENKDINGNCLPNTQLFNGMCKTDEQICNLKKSVYVSSTNTCYCQSGLKYYQNNCYTDEEICNGINTVYDEMKNECGCKTGYSFYKNICENNEYIEKSKKYELEQSRTISQKNAIRSANNYLNYGGFSKQGLIEQLIYEQFSEADSNYAVESLGIDWKEQAVRVAKAYLNFTGFSRNGLIEQLEFDGFTKEQSIYGVDSVGL